MIEQIYKISQSNWYSETFQKDQNLKDIFYENTFNLTNLSMSMSDIKYDFDEVLLKNLNNFDKSKLNSILKTNEVNNLINNGSIDFKKILQLFSKKSRSINTASKADQLGLLRKLLCDTNSIYSIKNLSNLSENNQILIQKHLCELNDVKFSQLNDLIEPSLSIRKFER